MPDTGRAEALYQAAAELFIARGYRDVDVADITAQVGVSQGTFYNYYRNKRDLLETIMSDTEAKLLDAFGGERSLAAIDSGEDYAAELDERVRRVVGYVADNGALMSFAALTAPGVDAESYAAVLRGYRSLSALATSFLSHGQRSGWVRLDVDLDVAGQAIVAAMVMSVLPVLIADPQAFDAAGAASACSAYLRCGVGGVLSQSSVASHQD
jgi:AcrR family transcriptional regulator